MPANRFDVPLDLSCPIGAHSEYKQETVDTTGNYSLYFYTPAYCTLRVLHVAWYNYTSNRASRCVLFLPGSEVYTETPSHGGMGNPNVVYCDHIVLPGGDLHVLFIGAVAGDVIRASVHGYLYPEVRTLP